MIQKEVKNVATKIELEAKRRFPNNACFKLYISGILSNIYESDP